MSCARYMLTLSVPGLPPISTKLKTRLGDIEGIQNELRHRLDNGDIENLVAALHERNGGIESMLENGMKTILKCLRSIN